MDLLGGSSLPASTSRPCSNWNQHRSRIWERWRTTSKTTNRSTIDTRGRFRINTGDSAPQPLMNICSGGASNIASGEHLGKKRRFSPCEPPAALTGATCAVCWPARMYRPPRASRCALESSVGPAGSILPACIGLWRVRRRKALAHAAWAHVTPLRPDGVPHSVP